MRSNPARTGLVFILTLIVFWLANELVTSQMIHDLQEAIAGLMPLIVIAVSVIILAILAGGKSRSGVR